MGSDDMDHMQHVETVALSDCEVLRQKEATYQGSWKRAGGRSAWFMARRNMDRLLTMMPAKPVPHVGISNVANIRATLMSLKHSVHYNLDPVKQTVAPLPGSIEATMAILDHVLDAYTADDVFARIAEKPKGEDGTVLACIRDLRRYFTLVEAEMISEGVVEPETKTYEQEQYPVDVYTMIADDRGMSREEVKDLINDLFYSDQGEWAREILRTGQAPAQRLDVTVAGGGGGKIKESDVVFPNARELGPTDIIVDGTIYERGKHPRKATDEDRARAAGLTLEEWVAQRLKDAATAADTPSCGDGSFDVKMQRRAERIADGGSQHARENPLFPHHLTGSEAGAIRARVGDKVFEAFYSRRAADVWQLEMIAVCASCPFELTNFYNLFYNLRGSDTWLLKESKIPREIRSNWPEIQLEMNQMEYEGTDKALAFMYTWQEGPQKWVLDAQFADWGREQG